MSDADSTTIDWRYHVQRCIEEGVSQAAYCREHDLVIHRFSYWHRKICATRSGHWLPVEIKQPATTLNAIELVLGGKRTLRIADGFDEHLLKQIIVAVEATP